jgi:flagellin-specific chaperone FliS
MARTLKDLAALCAEDDTGHAGARAALGQALSIFEEVGAELDLEKGQALGRGLA